MDYSVPDEGYGNDLLTGQTLTEVVTYTEPIGRSPTSFPLSTAVFQPKQALSGSKKRFRQRKVRRTFSLKKPNETDIRLKWGAFSPVHVTWSW